MRRHAVLLVAAAVMCVSCAATSGPTYFGFEVGVSSAPPPPHVVLYDRPQFVVVQGTGVYVVSNADPDYDMFRYGSYWYVCSSGYWYRARSYSGTYRVIDVRSVPRAVVSVPARHWKHHPHGGPPGQMKKRAGWGT